MISTAKAGWNNFPMMNISPQSPMSVVLEAFPGARRPLTQLHNPLRQRMPAPAHLAGPIKRRARQPHCLATLRDAAPVLRARMLHRPPLGRRACHFFAFTSGRLCTCTVSSATARLSRTFSSSSPFNLHVSHAARMADGV